MIWRLVLTVVIALCRPLPVAAEPRDRAIPAAVECATDNLAFCFYVASLDSQLSALEETVARGLELLGSPEPDNRMWRTELAREGDRWVRQSQTLEPAINTIFQDEGAAVQLRGTIVPLVAAVLESLAAATDVSDALLNVEVTTGRNPRATDEAYESARGHLLQAEGLLALARVALPDLED